MHAQDHRTFHNFLKLAEIKIDAVERLKGEKMRQVYIESGCGKATQLLRDAWHQEVLDIELRFSNNRFMVFTKNSRAVDACMHSIKRYLLQSNIKTESISLVGRPMLCLERDSRNSLHRS